MGKKNTDSGASMFTRTENMFDVDPMQEIFELNLGDFMVEHLISDELAQKIGKNVHNKLDNIKRQLKELISIYSIDKTLSLLGFNAKEEHIIYNSIAKTAKQMIGIENCYIYLSKENCLEDTGEKLIHLVGISDENITHEDMAKMSLDIDENSIVTEAYNSRKVIEYRSKEEIEKNNFYARSENICYQLAIPMYNNLENVGVILIEKTDPEPMTEAYESLIKATASLFATSIVLQKLVEEIKYILKEETVSVSHLQQLRAELTGVIGDLGEQQQLFVEAMALAVDRRTKYRNAHSKETAELSKKICEFLNLNEKTKDLIYYAGLLQNIGKITLPSEIFNKKESLSKEDWDKLENHPNIGVSLIMNINFMSEVVPYIHYHKERWDGNGKPEGLKSFSIPLGSRIIAVADAYCALRTDRTYRKAYTKDEAIKIIREEAETKWDPMLVDVIEKISY